ncbi:MAG: asparagine synthase (glutamine-hydrolyzing) [Bryobacterales bacterium]|nr:asparagine synthase (glutamine-hydrolyzing) [Bryobacterales bacterium]
MCGIAGIFDPSGRLDSIGAMTAIQRHRGPDDEGYLFLNSGSGQWVQAGGPDTPPAIGLENWDRAPTSGCDLALASRRLAILDLSVAGHMPMSRDGGRLWIVHNGEVYNYRDIRDELKALGHHFESDTDTEVILAAYQQWGTGCLQYFNGMFSFALWDSHRRQLFCARDRFGVKPFYYFWRNGIFVFGSELKSVLAHPLISRRPDDTRIYDYLLVGRSDHTEKTFFDGVVALPQAHFLLLQPARRQISVHRWWDLKINPALDAGCNEEQASSDFVSLLEDAVRLRLRSDVPIGSCLSGGLDSSSIVMLANRLLLNSGAFGHHTIGDRQKTFTARNHSPEIDEFQYSHLVVERTGAEENIVYPSGERFWQEARRFVWHMDEPVDSTSQYPQWNVMRLARERGVTVLLDGQGGDEVLAGYYAYWPHYLNQLRHQAGARRLFREMWNVSRVGGRPARDIVYQDFVEKLPWRLRQILCALRPFRAGPGQGGSGLKDWQVNPEFLRRFEDRAWRPAGPVGARGLAGVLHDDIASNNLPKLLRFEDRSSMAFSLETRLPFLDYRLVEYVFSLPLSCRIRNGWNKWILRRSLDGLLPKEISWRRSKLGFPVPERDWLIAGASFVRQTLQGAAKDWAAAYVKSSVIEETVMRPDAELVETPGLWRLVNLMLWFEVFIGSPLDAQVKPAFAAEGNK